MAAPWRTPRMGGISCASWHSTTWSVPRKYKRLTPAYTGPYLHTTRRSLLGSSSETVIQFDSPCGKMNTNSALSYTCSCPDKLSMALAKHYYGTFESEAKMAIHSCGT